MARWYLNDDSIIIYRAAIIANHVKYLLSKSHVFLLEVLEINEYLFYKDQRSC